MTRGSMIFRGVFLLVGGLLVIVLIVAMLLRPDLLSFDGASYVLGGAVIAGLRAAWLVFLGARRLRLSRNPAADDLNGL